MCDTSNAKVVFISPTLKLQHSDTHAPKKQNTTKCQKRKTSHPEIHFPHIISPEMSKLLPSLDELRRKEQFEGERYCVNETVYNIYAAQTPLSLIV